MDINWLGFVGVVAIAYVIPGPDMAVILRAATRGWRPGGAAAVGAQAGLCVHLALAVAGLSVVLARYPEALTALRIAGGLYLMYLGGRLILPTLRRDPKDEETSDDASPRSAFGQALFTNLLNPKAVLFFAAVLPQFLVTGDQAAAVWAQVLALGALDVLLGFAVWALVVGLGVRLTALLKQRRARQWWDRVTGTALGVVGGGLVLRH
ncbi:LysE family translocator [Promicromonospora citrea]|uniref:Threonine efflux protein n=1 Tax=Promicromonospora citrea TaxID=43677 RepID=A0A8H9GHP3_9MICO|nr:LysE family translocator [Promicromonospora citrea]NNH52487.1 LysE family translocator [Promicromonospora citrea]GGM24663.1 threonine efflux protein [Promicromonospora citrea]